MLQGKEGERNIIPQHYEENWTQSDNGNCLVSLTKENNRQSGAAKAKNEAIHQQKSLYS